MGFLPNIFSDPVLAARQSQLDSQWKALHKLSLSCGGLTDESWTQFENDYLEWVIFYDSGSDWTQSSEKATNIWQNKAQEWESRFAAASCRGFTVADDIVTPDTGLPGVKEPPPLSEGILDSAIGAFEKTTDALSSPFKTLGWVAVGIVVLILIAIVWITTQGQASGYGISVGGK